MAVENPLQGNLQIGAYFYPLTQSCELREAGARQFWAEGVPSELMLARNAQPLFDRHDQPRSYCLPDLDTDFPALRTEWDDADTSAMLAQVKLAREYGISYFIFDSYRGLHNGQAVHEMAAVTEATDHVMRTLGDIGMRYARMETLERPRALLPIPMRGRQEYFFCGARSGI